MKKTTKLFLVLILSFIVVLFSVINAQKIEVNLMLAKISLPLVVIIIGSVLVGALIVAIVISSTIWQKNKTIKQLKQEVHALKTTETSNFDLADDEESVNLRQELKNKELEISDLRHQLVNQMMSEKKETPEISDWQENTEN
ncbi:LapA family protein [Vagococcus hydrophili]|uniref:DUF1049 domain-containing protein n=1 Tax=Vagococcus hydrophili TaxID=2714947 RepID=A0A6G8AVC4_9ENTE|nr:lipopolysaccharide assembly protein LapA domain-containing protein [Vagococcus hydrophili]QIL48885.1 DUF1049 domain-containing protein [Vagococcus hydrophili]